MASRQHAQIHLTNQENFNSRFAIKSTSIQSDRMVQKRAALGEINYKYQAIPKLTSAKQNEPLPDPKAKCRGTRKPLIKTDRLQQVMPPHRVPVKKTVTISGPSKDTKGASSIAIIAESRIPKPVPVSRREAKARAEKIVDVATRFASRSRGVTSRDIVHSRGATISLDNAAGSNPKNESSQQNDFVGTSRIHTGGTFKSAVEKPESVGRQNEPGSNDGVAYTGNHAAIVIDSSGHKDVLRGVACDTESTSEKILKSYSSSRLEFPDPDENCKENPMMVAEYASDIFQYLRSLEGKMPVQKDFLKGQKVTPKMRMILVDWLVAIHNDSGLLPETLFLCVSIVDRYMQENTRVTGQYFQLVGIAALLIASKYEEFYAPSLGDFEYISANTFSKRKILAMEREILKKLNFNLGRPLAVHFLRRYGKLAQIQSRQHALGMYMLELALMEYEPSHVSPSLQAAAVCCLSMGILNEVEDLSTVWTPALAHHSGYEYSRLKGVVLIMADLLVKSESSRFQTIKIKYSSMKNLAISTCPLLCGPLVKKLSEEKMTTTKSECILR